MAQELVQLFQEASKAADLAAMRASSGEAEESRCLDALKRLKTIPVTSQVLMSTQVGKGIRRLTKHPKKKIQAFASDLIQEWKQIVTEESNGCKRKEAEGGKDSVNGGTNHKVEEKCSATDDDSPETPTSKARRIERNGAPGSNTVKKTDGGEKPVHAVNKLPANHGPQKLTPLAKSNDPTRDKVRELLLEALSKVSSETEGNLIEEVNASDPARVAVTVESVMFANWGKMNGVHKVKYRSIMFNIKDQNNPDFRRKILLGEITPERLLNMTTQEMASDQRQKENQQIQEKAMFDCELGAAPKATTDEFKCARCGQRKCTYYQMQTRSADEPMTTYVTCVNCNNHWKFC